MSVNCDYLVVGSGASAMSFVDTILETTDASVAMVDRRAVPGGHWNDSYSFVRLHQPALMYGVSSKPLGHNRIEPEGLNAGMFELSSGVEIVNYYHELMNEVFLPSGRVTYLPLHEYVGEGEVVGLLSGVGQHIEHTTLVDGTFLTTSVPSTHERKFGVAAGVVCVPPNELPRLAPGRPHITVLGGGKTGCDALTWLLSNGYPAEAITWVVPRDSWFWNRKSFQLDIAFFETVVGDFLEQFEAMAAATTVDGFCLDMEKRGRWLRLDEDVQPTMFHAAILSETELETLRRVTDVVRGKRVRQIESDAMVFDDGATPAIPGTLYVDCTASAVEDNVDDLTPIFAPGRINLQMIRQFQPCFSAALIAFIESSIDDDDERQQMTRPTPMTDTPDDFLRGIIAGMLNQAAWSANEKVAHWIAQSRLDGMTSMAMSVAPDDAEKLALLERLGELGPHAVGNVMQLMAAD